MDIMGICIDEAKQLNDNLFPADCLDILKSNYGNRLEIMKPITIMNKVYRLMNVLTDNTESQQIIDVVNDYLNNG